MSKGKKRLHAQTRSVIDSHRSNGESILELAQIADEVSQIDRRINTSPHRILHAVRAIESEMEGVTLERVARPGGWEKRHTTHFRVRFTSEQHIAPEL